MVLVNLIWKFGWERLVLNSDDVAVITFTLQQLEWGDILFVLLFRNQKIYSCKHFPPCLMFVIKIQM
jgi:hypothetical protein